jgi:hypothetical protein
MCGCLFGQFDLKLRKLTLTDKIEFQSGSFRTGFTYPTTPPSGNLIWKLPNADAVGCLQSDGSFQLSIVACSGGSTLPVIDTTKIVKGSVDATKELRFEIDGFTTGTTNVLTPQDASYVIAGTNITNTFSASQITRDLIPSGAGSWNVGTLSDPYSTMIATTFYTRLVGLSCNYINLGATALGGGTLNVQNSACATQARMSSTGFDTVGTVGSYRVQGTDVITAGRNLRNIVDISTDLIPTVTNTYSLGANTGTGYFAFSYITNGTFDIINPKTSSATIGAPGAGNGFATIYGDAIAARTSFRLGTSTTAGYVMTADASGFGSWQPAAGGTSLPVSDTTNIVRGSADVTKLLRFEVDGFTSGTTRTLTPQNASYTIAGTDISNTFTATNSFLATQITRTIRPDVDNNFDLGEPGFRFRQLYGMVASLSSNASGITTVLSIPNATSSFAISVPNGGVAANTFVGASAAFSTSLSVTGTSTFQTVVPSANNTFSVGSTSARWNVYWGRFLNLRTVGAALAGIAAFDNSGNLTFSMGDGGGFGGEFIFYNGSLAEYFAAINGQLRFNGSWGLSSNFTCPAGQAVKSMNIQNGGTITATCGVP